MSYRAQAEELERIKIELSANNYTQGMVEKAEAERDALKRMLGELWDLYENGVNCYEDVDNRSYIGNAVRPSEALEKRIFETLAAKPLEHK